MLCCLEPTPYLCGRIHYRQSLDAPKPTTSASPSTNAAANSMSLASRNGHISSCFPCGRVAVSSFMDNKNLRCDSREYIASWFKNQLSKILPIVWPFWDLSVILRLQRLACAAWLLPFHPRYFRRKGWMATEQRKADLTIKPQQHTENTLWEDFLEPFLCRTARQTCSMGQTTIHISVQGAAVWLATTARRTRSRAPSTTSRARTSAPSLSLRLESFKAVGRALASSAIPMRNP